MYMKPTTNIYYYFFVNFLIKTGEFNNFLKKKGTNSYLFVDCYVYGTVNKRHNTEWIVRSANCPNRYLKIFQKYQVLCLLCLTAGSIVQSVA